MRMQGTLKKWNADKAYGFISQGQGKPDLFVHLSAFQKNGQVPQTGQVLTFDVVQGQDGRWQAVRVLRQGETARLELEPMRRSPQPRPLSQESRPTAHPPSRVQHRPYKRTSRLWRALPILVVVAGIWGYQELIAPRLASSTHTAAHSLGDWNTMQAQSQENQPSVQCDGRQHCSQMASCAEAKYFLANCPNTKMDGDGDGIPCEQQLCSF